MADPARAEARYTAFLSYSHADAAAAGRLHRRLEAYRMPKRLVGSQGARGPVPDRLWPIFRDREELPAATDLSETVRAALAASGALIILCSRAAAGSLWVAEEIDAFRALHPDRPILAAILDGDPPDCFPTALRAFGRDGTWHEPLATDLRPGKDGKQLGLLKLVAGITGVGLDALVQRDAARRVRRITVLSALALIALLIMTGLAAVAIDARREAERQRAEAEGQIEFMLTDLRERLRGVGRLDIMTAVNRRALRYYGSQDLEELSPDSLERRARVLLAMGEDEISGGNLVQALKAFRDAHQTTAALLTRAPNDRQRIFAHAQSEYWVGEVYYHRREWRQARQYFARYEQAAERLIAIVPNSPDYMMEAGYGASNMGRVQLYGLENPVAAHASFERALRWFERVERVRPRDETAQRKQANAHAWLADTFYARRLWPEALAARQRQHRIYERLYRANPLDRARLYDLALAERAIGRQMSILGQREAGASHLLTAYAYARTLRWHDSSNVDWLLLKAMIECELLYDMPTEGRAPSIAQLRGQINAAATQLSTQNNPRASELTRCLSWRR